MQSLEASAVPISADFRQLIIAEISVGNSQWQSGPQDNGCRMWGTCGDPKMQPVCISPQCCGSVHYTFAVRTPYCNYLTLAPHSFGAMDPAKVPDPAAWLDARSARAPSHSGGPRETNGCDDKPGGASMRTGARLPNRKRPVRRRPPVRENL